MSAIVRQERGGAVQEFNPDKTRVRLAHIEGDIITFRHLQDWPALEEAAAAKMEEQSAFLGNWDERVRPPGHQVNNLAGGYLTVSDAEAAWGVSQQTVSKWRKALADPDRYRSKIILGGYRAALLKPEHTRVSPNSGVQQWFTPAQYIEAARQVMQGIDLDPASHPQAQEVVRAERWYGPEDDGLAQPWAGRVWLNPPYSFPLIEKFARRLVDEYRAGAVSEAIMLTNNCTDTGWFHYAERDALSLCFTLGRINFYGPDGIGEAPLQGQTFFYYGHQEETFARIFGAFGFIR